jgi:hypothetical protein
MAERNTKHESLEHLFVKKLIRTISWGIVLLLTVAIFLLGANQNIKEAIDFSFKNVVGELYYFASSHEVKQDVKVMYKL